MRRSGYETSTKIIPKAAKVAASTSIASTLDLIDQCKTTTI